MPFRNEQTLSKERMNYHVSNSKTYHVNSDKIAVSINSIIKFWRSQIERTSQSVAFAIMRCCAFISACKLVFIELMQENQKMNLAKMTRTCERILQKQQSSCTVIYRDLWIYGGLVVDLIIRSSLFFAVFVF